MTYGDIGGKALIVAAKKVTAIMAINERRGSIEQQRK